MVAFTTVDNWKWSLGLAAAVTMASLVAAVSCLANANENNESAEESRADKDKLCCDSKVVMPQYLSKTDDTWHPAVATECDDFGKEICVARLGALYVCSASGAYALMNSADEAIDQLQADDALSQTVSVAIKTLADEKAAQEYQVL